MCNRSTTANISEICNDVLITLDSNTFRVLVVSATDFGSTGVVSLCYEFFSYRGLRDSIFRPESEFTYST